MKPIKVLDNLTINKIAAGEVVERPSSIVKELLENSIDARASAITIEIKDGGTTLIKISDNGSGIPKDEVKTAFLRHATSKITSIDDLQIVNSLGFRGEALASIAAVSQLEIITKTINEETGSRLEVSGGSFSEVSEVSSVLGTSIIVKNIFFNVPARRKFLKKPSTESSYVTDVVNKAALGHPEVSIKYINNGNTMLHTPGTNDVKAVALFIFGKDFSDKTLDLDFKDKIYSIKGLIGKPELSRANRTYEYFFINGRPIKSPLIASAVEDAYKTRLMTGKFPVFILDLNVDLSLIDINVHPSKLEARFSREAEVYDFVFKAVDKTLKNSNLIPKADWDSNNSTVVKELIGDFKPAYKGVQQSLNTDIPKAEIEATPLKEVESNSINNTVEDINECKKNDTEVDNSYIVRPSFGLRGYAPKTEGESNIDRLLKYNESKSDTRPNTLKQTTHEYQTKNNERQPFFNNYKIIGQAFKTYWIIEQGKSLFVIDQHAAHEKILFEELTNRLKSNSIVSQGLIEEIRLNLIEKELLVLEDNLDIIKRLGFDLERDENGYILKGVPFIFKNPLNPDYFIDILDLLAETKPETIYDIKLDTIASMACKSAVKANDRLSESEAISLIKQILELENPFSCPHGRPTIIELTEYELEKKFKRIV